MWLWQAATEWRIEERTCEADYNRALLAGTGVAKAEADCHQRFRTMRSQ